MDLKYDNEKCCSVPLERASRELLRQLDRMVLERRPEVCFGCGMAVGGFVRGAVRRGQVGDLPGEEGEQEDSAAKDHDSQDEVHRGGGAGPSGNGALDQLEQQISQINDGNQIDAGMGVGTEFPLQLFL